MTGRKPTPTGLRLLKGNPGKRALNRDEPIPEGGLGPAPKRLPKYVRDAWADLALQAWWATDSDRAAFEILSYNIAQARKLRKDLEKEPRMVKGSRGEVRNPKSYELREAEDRAARLIGEFGMTPSSRSRVKVPKRPKRDPMSEFD